MQNLPPRKHNRVAYVMVGIVFGGLAIGLPCLIYIFSSQHQYRELDTFFKGQMGEYEVQGISYLDYHGIGFLEGNQWKVQLIKKNSAPVIIYQNRSSFQESIPHQPNATLEGNQLHLDDGEVALTVTIEDDLPVVSR